MADDVPSGEPAAGDDAMQVAPSRGSPVPRSDCLLIRFLSADDLELMTKRAAQSGCVPQGVQA
jgi:hypothetical protein